MTNAYMMARSRAAGGPSKTVRRIAERDDALWRAALAERKLEILRRRLLNMNPHARPEYLPGDKLAILELMWLCGWSILETAKRFVLHRTTIGSWLRRLRAKADPEAFLGKPPRNKIGESVRWLVHEMKSLGMGFGTGTRAIAVEIRRVAVKVSRSSAGDTKAILIFPSSESRSTGLRQPEEGRFPLNPRPRFLSPGSEYILAQLRASLDGPQSTLPPSSSLAQAAGPLGPSRRCF